MGIWIQRFLIFTTPQASASTVFSSQNQDSGVASGWLSSGDIGGTKVIWNVIVLWVNTRLKPVAKITVIFIPQNDWFRYIFQAYLYELVLYSIYWPQSFSEAGR